MKKGLLIFRHTVLCAYSSDIFQLQRKFLFPFVLAYWKLKRTARNIQSSCDSCHLRWYLTLKFEKIFKTFNFFSSWASMFVVLSPCQLIFSVFQTYSWKYEFIWKRVTWVCLPDYYGLSLLKIKCPTLKTLFLHVGTLLAGIAQSSSTYASESNHDVFSFDHSKSSMTRVVAVENLLQSGVLQRVRKFFWGIKMGRIFVSDKRKQRRVFL